MKRYFLTIMCMLLCMTMRSQEVRTWQYWFDNDFAAHVTSTFADSIMHADIDVGLLSEGIHTINVQVRDTSMKWTAPARYLFVKTAQYQQDTIGGYDNLFYHCWFDNDYSTVQSNSLVSDNFLLDVSNISNGMHTVNVMFKSESYSPPLSYIFMNVQQYHQDTTGISDKIIYHCWFDDDYSTVQSDSIGYGYFFIDVSDLSNEMHTVNVMLESNSLIPPMSYLFMKVQQYQQDTIGMGDNLIYHCWFDDDYSTVQSDSLGSGNILLDVTGLSDGMHTVNVMLDGNSLTPPQGYMFMKVKADTTGGELKYHYWFDDDTSTEQIGLVGGGNILIDVADLSDGIHTISIVFDNGTLSAPLSYIFYKKPVGGTKITQWEYWLNGNYDDKILTVLDTPQCPFNLLGLIPVATQPIRSSCFKFDPNDGEPMIYAYNEITMRFWSNDAHYIDRSAMYVDEQVSQTVEAEVFERNTVKNIASPTNNQIKWFKLDAVIGDSLAFKSDRACTMQLFAPSGEEVYSAQGPESMEYNGCHAWEDGTYYLAVHDANGSNYSDIDVSYQYIHKFAILAHSPQSIGNRTHYRFVMDLIGNGFLSLEDIYLKMDNNIIHADSSVYSSMSHATMEFHITDSLQNGLYDLYALFRKNDVTDTIFIENAIRLEDIDFGERLVTFSAPERMAKPYPIVITIENTGNVDLAYVPFNIACTNPQNIEKIEFMDFSVAVSNEADSAGYSFGIYTENLLGKQIEGAFLFTYIPYLKAKEVMSFTLGFTAPGHTHFDLYAWTGNGYVYDDYFDTLVNGTRCGGNRATEMAQNVLDAGRVAQAAGGLLGRPSNLAGRAANVAVMGGVAIAAYQNSLGHMVDKAYLDANGIDPNSDLGQEILNLHPMLASPGEIIGGRLGEILDNIMGFQRQCCDNPEPDPGEPYHGETVVPGDPNDIYGYVSESGSHYIRQEIQNLSYEIEFENDTTLATAAAHTIVITDTLDATRFDLSSFAAQSVTIGENRMDLNGEQSFIYTMDMRPDIDVVAQIQLEFDTVTGIARWTMTSLDPMTMEPTTDPFQGLLPVNYFGNGVGTVDYLINLKDKFADGTLITNRACIVFDQEDPILTPKWANIVDAVLPTSHIEEATPVADSLNFSFVSSDNRSGIWYHTLYYRNDSTFSEWKIKKTNIFDDSYKMKLDDFLTTDYMVIAIDSAGNRESKDFSSEYTFKMDDYNYYNLVVSDPLECGEVTGSGTYVENSDIAIEAIPSEGYHFEQWNDADTCNPRIVHLIQDTTFTAQFAINQYLVKVMSEDSIMGTVSGGGVFNHGSNVSVMATSNIGYKFLYWIESDTIVSNNVVFTFQIRDDRSFMAVFEPGNAQSSMLAEGWNWYSTYIDVEGESGFEMLTTDLGSNALTVKSQTGFSMYYEDYNIWDGSLSTIDNKQMYMIKMTNGHTLRMSGGICDAPSIELTLQPGWNWIGYPSNNASSLVEAFANFTPSDGDYMKSQTAFAAYYEGYGWDGSLVTLSPGQGFMYNNNSSSAKTLTYSVGDSKSIVEENVSTDGNHWQPNIYGYQNNMNITAVVTLDDEELASDSYEVGAFCGDECRGSATLVYNEIIGRYVMFMTVYGNDSDILSFKLYDAATNTEHPYFANNTEIFVPNAIIGNLVNPYVISFSFDGIIEEETVGIDIYPNPVGIGCPVSLNGMYGRVQVVNSLGVIVKEYQNVDQLDGFDSPGLYIIMINNGKSIVYVKLMVE